MSMISAISTTSGVGTFLGAENVMNMAMDYVNNSLPSTGGSVDNSLPSTGGSNAANMSSDEYVLAMDKAYQDAMKSIQAGQAASGGFYGQAIGTMQQGLGDASAFRDQMAGFGEEYMQYAQGMYEDWENMFGDMRGNLVDYYDNLSADKYATQMKGQVQHEMQRATQQFDEMAAQSGIYTSGMKLQNKKEAMYGAAQQRQSIDLEAEDYVMDRKTQFYGAFGEPARNQALGMVDNAYGNQASMASMGQSAMSGAYSNLASAYQGAGANAMAGSTAMAGAQQNYGSMYGDLFKTKLEADAAAAQAKASKSSSIFGSIGSIAGGIFGGPAGAAAGGALGGLFSDARLKKNIKHVGTQDGHNVYTWDWTEQGKALAGNQPTRGVIAQEVMQTHPGAVSEGPSGYLLVDYGEL